MSDYFDCPTWGRKPNLDDFMAGLAIRFPHGGGFLVEVGGMRAPGNVQGDGCAAAAWATHAALHAETFVSIDVDPVAVANTQRLSRAGLPVLAVCDDGARAISGIRGPIHLLYLDGSNDPEQALGQLLAALPVLVVGSLVVVDDQDVKAPAVRRWMDEHSTWFRPVGTSPGCNQAAWERI